MENGTVQTWLTELAAPPAVRKALRRALSAGGCGRVASVEDGERAWLAAAAAREAPGLVVAVTESPRAMERLADDLAALGVAEEARSILPPVRSESSRLVTGRLSPEAEGERLRTLQRCLDAAKGPKGKRRGKGLVVVTCLQALLEPLPPPEWLEGRRRRVAAGTSCDPEALCDALVRAGYEFGAEVLAKGQASRRGGVLDIWPPTEEWPARLEFFGDELESIRWFDPADQRSRGKAEVLELPPASEEGETVPGAAEAPRAGVEAYLPEDASFVWFSPEGLLHHYAMGAELAGAGESADPERSVWREFTNWRMAIARRFTAGGQLDAGGEDGTTAFPLRGETVPIPDAGVRPFDGLAGLSDQVLPPDALDRERAKLAARLDALAAEGWKLHFCFATEAAAKRFAEAHGAIAAAAAGLHAPAALSGGFVLPGAKVAVVAESDFYGTRPSGPAARRRGQAAARARDATGERLADWTDLRPGELVVHVDHGIGKYLGLYEIVFDGQPQEALAVEYAEGARLYVPTSQTHLLSRYVGVGRTRPPLHALGGQRWLREKVAAERAARDLAAEMLETQAKRSALPGHAFAPDTPWQDDFERAFPYTETPDQLRAAADVKRDMESPRPMDRLVCGDAGYGKTEVAMRAAFKAVMDGKQVAVLVPTTVLAQQHYETFRGRLGRFPVTVEVLSRFSTPVRTADILARTAAGKVDVLIGTHRLLGAGVEFRDLGLLVVDEEQRFGVAAKEHLKRLHPAVDVLTLSATPIPRTLYLSLTGARDMSLVQTPPRERLAIETYVAQDTDELLREAILRELDRGGQVFFLHNRIGTIAAVRERLLRLVPRLRIGVGHGRMGERELAGVMRDFVRGKYDLLLCTTIIESGVDIPNVNTILIDRADRFGMADLHQIRGRVGRGRVQAYAYLLLPRHGGLFGAARERIQAIRRTASLGAGYKLALRDLEIRGAGNVLGHAQSGHIAAVGFDLYCQLLDRTIARLKGEAPPPVIDVQTRFEFLDLSPDPADAATSAAIPRDYIEDENLRIGIYRKLASVAGEAAAAALADEIRDRFGPPPAPVRRLLAIARIRVLAAALGVRTVMTDGDRLLLSLPGKRYLMPNGRHVRLHRHGPDDRLAEIEKRLRSLAAAPASPPSPVP